MNDMQELEVLSLSNNNILNASNTTLYANQFIEALGNGEIDIIEAYARMKILSDVFDQVKDASKEWALNAMSRQDKGFVKFGYKWEEVEAGVKYDFSVCNHTKLTEKLNKIEELKKEAKILQDSLKSAGKVTIIDEETGEVCNPPLKTSTTTIKMTKVKAK